MSIIVFIITAAGLQAPGETVQCKLDAFFFLIQPPPVYESDDTASTDEISVSEERPVKAQEFNIGPLPLSVSRAR